MEQLKPFNKDSKKVDLFSWISSHRSEDEMREVFLNMDIALKYIHAHGYCIEIFHPSKIFVLDDQVDHIQFECLTELDSSERNEMVKEDIFNSSLIQIGLYTNTLKYLTPQFLRDNFDDIARFIPEGDVPYYRGVVQRGASVYFSEFALEKMNRDLIQLEKQINESEGKKDNTSVENNVSVENLSNDKINDSIYKQINGLRDAAFINWLIIPTIILLSLVLISILFFIISFK